MPRQKAKVLAEPLLSSQHTPSWGQRHWAPIFYANVFMACISFSVVMPSLWLYLSKMGSNHTFYACVVSSYSIGEAAGSLMFGSLSNSFGTRRTLLLCCIVSCTGAVSYAMAYFVYTDISAWAAPFFVLLGRLLQGVGSGGQQAVEQSYLSIAVTTAQRTEYTGKLSTFASSGFICGPAFAAVVGALPEFRLGSLVFDCFTMQGWSCVVMNILMYLLYYVFEEKAPPDHATAQSGGKSAQHATTPSTPIVGVLACIFFFFVHFNGFAVQETITTPLVQDWFGWTEVAANVLFTGAGLLNLICAIVMAYLCSPQGGTEGAPQRVPDHVLLVVSLVVAPLGWLCMVPPSSYDREWPSMSVAQFLTGFGLVTVAFPFGRGVCLSMVGKLLGDRPQGTWMGVTFAVGAIARIVGPFWAVQGYRVLGALVVFGLTAALFVLSLVALVPRAALMQRQHAVPRASPQMLFNLGTDDEVKDVVIQDRPNAMIDPSQTTPEPGYDNPGKMEVNEIEMVERTAKLDALAAKWRKRQEQLEWDQGLNVGWVFKAEVTNGRLGMFFLIVGLITEYYTGESLPQQTLTMFRTLGVID